MQLEVKNANLCAHLKDVATDCRADVIIATGPWPQVLRAAEVGSQTSTPVISLASSQPLTFAPNRYLFRMSSSIAAYVHCMSDLIKSHYWRRVILLYEEDDYGSIAGTIIPLLSNAFQAIGLHIDYQAAFPPLHSLSQPNTVIHNELKRINQRLCKVFIVLRWSSPSLALNLFRDANSLGMMAKNSVWIVGDDITAMLDSSKLDSSISYMQGVVGITAYLNESNRLYSDIQVQFFEKAQTGLRMYAARAYDAVVLIAHAAASSQKRGQSLRQAVQLANFVGLTGPVRFGKDGLVDGKGSSVFQIINFVGTGYRDVGFWVSELGFLKMDQGNAIVHMPEPIYWPGGPTRIPGGWGEIRIGVPNHTSFDKFVKVEYDGKGQLKSVSGFCIEVFEEALKRLPYDLSYHYLTSSGDSFDDLVAAIPKEYDAAVGDITIVSHRLENASFTVPFVPSGLAMIVPVKKYNSQAILTSPFSYQVWCVIAAVVLYTGFIVWYLEHKRNPEFNGPWWTQLGATFWLISSSIFFKHGKLHNYYTKVVIMVWLVAVLVLTNTYTASLSSILTIQKLKPVPGEGKIGCSGPSFVYRYLKDVLGYKDNQIYKITEAEKYVEAFDSGKITIACLEVPYMRVFLSEYQGYTPYGETHELGGFGFPFWKDSPIAEDLSRAILNLSEDGTLKRMEDKWFSISLTNCPISPEDGSKNSITLDSFWVLFLLTGVTTTIVLLVYKTRSPSIAAVTRRACKKIGVSVRSSSTKFMNLKLRYRKTPHPISRGTSFSSPQVAPGPPEGTAQQHDTGGEIEISSSLTHDNIHI